jgi:hypothetical protein
LLLGVAAALTEGDILARFEALEARNAKLEANNAKLEAKNAEIQATLNAVKTTGELKIFNAEKCPPGWVELNKTQGYLLTGRPKGGRSGTAINRPMDVGEKGRAPEHSHEVVVEDLGHTHTMVVNDPGHSHTVVTSKAASTGKPIVAASSGGAIGAHVDIPTIAYSNVTYTNSHTKTGIVVDALPTKSNIQVSLVSNDAGEGYPLVYVLVCQRAL